MNILNHASQPIETQEKYDGSSSVPLIVAIGASAGGLEAFRSFFSSMPSDSGMAFVLVQHLAPDHESMMVELLSPSTSMKIAVTKTGMEIAANRIYVIPPNATLTIENRHFIVKSPAPPRNHRRPIDTFLFSLAQDQGENAVCIILSGTGSDGSLGLVAVKEEGGMTFAQAEDGEGAMSGMPSNAVATGQVDYVLPVQDIPAKLMEYYQHLGKVEHFKNPDGIRQDAADYLPEIFALIRSGVGHDFSHYKVKTLVRRVQRRMQALQVDTIAGFIEILEQEPKELELLFRDLLIGVTEFFRDSAAFAALETNVIPRLLADKNDDNQIRVWVPACATGDEAYSLAILLLEAVHKTRNAPKVTIFATDIDDRAVAYARDGRYLKSHLDGVSPERLERWFIKEDGHYCVSPQIREMCIFSTHSVVKDPPFSKLDLISCRNLLIYLDVVLQDRLIPMFHYSLCPGGYLFLGLSESVGRQSEFFSVVDEKFKLFTRRDDTTPMLPHLPLSSLGARSASLFSEVVPVNTIPENTVERGARRVMEQYSPAHIVIDKQYRVHSFSGQTGKYLEPSPGAATLNLFNLIQKPLRPAMRSLLQQAFETGQRVVKEKIPFEVNGKNDIVTLIAEPILPATGQAIHYIIVFQHADNSDTQKKETPAKKNRPDLAQLENELQATKARLQAAIDEAEATNEELKSANEEFQSVNEELQSSNEELQTSKEEIQSINEELQTVNSELKSRNDILVRVNSDLQNFLESTQIATMFLDENFCVRNFTPTITQLFHLRESDIGRPITEVASRLNYNDLETDVRKTLKNLTVIEREVYLPESNDTYLMHIRPYRTVTKVVDGVVITFIDVTDRKRHERQRDLLMGELNHRVKNTLAIVQSMARQTAKDAVSVDAFSKTFEDRILALSRTHNLLVESQWQGASLEQVARAELLPYGDDRFTLEGSDIRLNPQEVIAIGMIFHELATNASKYGALSVANGRVKLSWTVGTPERLLKIVWIETGGPLVKKPTRRGFGSRLIEQSIASEKRGEAHLDFESSGVRCSIQFVLAEVC